MDCSIKIVLMICTASKSNHVFFCHPTNVNGNAMQVKPESAYVINLQHDIQITTYLETQDFVHYHVI